MYEKALKRRDPSGATGQDVDKNDSDAAKGKAGTSKNKADGDSGNKKEGAAKQNAKGDKKKSNVQEGRGSSSTGKIVSLMSGDANKLSLL